MTTSTHHEAHETTLAPHDDPHLEHSGHHVENGQLVVLYVSFFILLGVLVRIVQRKFLKSIPFTVIIFFVGFGFGVFAHEYAMDDEVPNYKNYLAISVDALDHIQPHTFLMIFIPPLIFESAFSIDFYIVFREKFQVLTLATFGVLINTILTGLLARYVMPTSYEWDWWIALLYGAIVSATDPVAVVSLLKTLGASRRLSTLIEGESLMNDGTAYVIFVILYEIVQDKHYMPGTQDLSDVQNVSVGWAIGQLFQLSLGGIGSGILFGLVFIFVIDQTFDDSKIEVSLTFSACYLCFFTTEIYFEASGLLAVVFLGLVFSRFKTSISSSVEQAMHNVWEIFAYCCEIIIFTLSGSLIAYRFFQNQRDFDAGVDIPYALLMYVLLHITRAITIAVCMPIMNCSRYNKLTWKDGCILTYGGLRGAIGLALVLIIDLDNNLPSLMRDKIFFHVCSVVVLTMLINATTIQYVLKFLGMTDLTTTQRVVLKDTLLTLLQTSSKTMQRAKDNKVYESANFNHVLKMMPDYHKLVADLDDVRGFTQGRRRKKSNGFLSNLKKSFGGSKSDVEDNSWLRGSAILGHRDSESTIEMDTVDIDQEPDDPEFLTLRTAHSYNIEERRFGNLKANDRSTTTVMHANIQPSPEDMERELKLRYFTSMKASYWHQFEHGMASRHVTSFVLQATDFAMDDQDFWVLEKLISDKFHIPWMVQWIYRSDSWDCTKRIVQSLFIHDQFHFAVNSATMVDKAIDRAIDLATIYDETEHNFTASVHRDIRAVQNSIRESVKSMQDAIPELYKAIITDHATTYCLHHEKQELERLWHNGLLEESEYQRMKRIVDKAMHRHDKSSVSAIFNEAENAGDSVFLSSFIFNDMEPGLRRTFFKRSKKFFLNQGEAFYKRGDEVKGIYVITRGIVESKSDDDETISFGPSKVFALPCVAKLNTSRNVLHKNNLTAASFVEYYLIPSAVVGDLVKEEGVNELLAKHIAITHITFKPEFGRFLTSSYDTFKKEQNWAVENAEFVENRVETHVSKKRAIILLYGDVEDNYVHPPVPSYRPCILQSGEYNLSAENWCLELPEFDGMARGAYMPAMPVVSIASFFSLARDRGYSAPSSKRTNSRRFDESSPQMLQRGHTDHRTTRISISIDPDLKIRTENYESENDRNHRSSAVSNGHLSTDVIDVYDNSEVIWNEISFNKNDSEEQTDNVSAN